MRLDSSERERLREMVAGVVKKHHVDIGGHSYTKPSSKVYEQQWLWDSCFHAIIHLDLGDSEQARSEIRAMLSRQVADGPDAGMVPHMNYFTGGGEALWGTPDRSGITQPPMLGSAVREIARRAGDMGFVREVFEPLCRYYSWLAARRDPDGDDLVSIIHPWESGWDNSQRWDELAGFGEDEERNKAIRNEMCARLKGLGFDSAAALAAGWFDVEPVDFNCIYAENLAALAWCAQELGFADTACDFAERARRVRKAIRSKMRDPATGLYFDIARIGGEERHIRVETPAMFFPLFAGVPTAGEAPALVRRLLSPSSFWPRYPVPTVSMEDPRFAPDRYWRGTTWVNINWFVMQGLLLYGFREAAEGLARRTVDLVLQNSLWEYYDPRTGRGLGAEDLSWSGLVIDMITLAET
ncbi:MAG: trehalase family glycosidase [Bacillota bacterium]|nr:trehalase family glycosidase [Bacillota bacterium]